MEMTEIRTIGTLHLGGQQHGFPPGSVVSLPADQAAVLIGEGHAELAVKQAPAPEPAPTPEPEPLATEALAPA